MLHDFLVFRLNDSIDKIIVPIKSYKMDWFIENNLYYDQQLDVEGSVPQLPQNTTLGTLDSTSTFLLGIYLLYHNLLVYLINNMNSKWWSITDVK